MPGVLGWGGGQNTKKSISLHNCISRNIVGPRYSPRQAQEGRPKLSERKGQRMRERRGGERRSEERKVSEGGAIQAPIEILAKKEKGRCTEDADTSAARARRKAGRHPIIPFHLIPSSPNRQSSLISRPH